MSGLCLSKKNGFGLAGMFQIDGNVPKIVKGKLEQGECIVMQNQDVVVTECVSHFHISQWYHVDTFQDRQRNAKLYEGVQFN